jgi:Aspartyl protease
LTSVSFLVPEIGGVYEDAKILVPVVIAGGVGQAVNLVEAVALLDTGATTTAIAAQLAEALKLRAVGRRIIDTAAGPRRANAYNFTLGFRQPPGQGLSRSPLFLPNEIYGLDFTRGITFDVLIGMDILGIGEFRMNRNRQWSFAF